MMGGEQEQTLILAVETDDGVFLRRVQVLRKTLCYGWSVAVAAIPDEDVSRLDPWMRSSDPDVCWIMRDNLKKKRLASLTGR
jgi:hypothetical protein